MSESQPTTDSPEKDPADWVTGDEPATGAQKSYLETLTRQDRRRRAGGPHQGRGVPRRFNELKS